MAVSKKKDNQYELILQTAFECISTKGYANVSMRDVAEKARVALSQITYHYKNKDVTVLSLQTIRLQALRDSRTM